jgi:hypothetical protein
VQFSEGIIDVDDEADDEPEDEAESEEVNILGCDYHCVVCG